jgi:hypothetical protein
MSTQDNFYAGSRQSIVFHPSGFRIRGIFPLIFIGAIVLLAARPGKATHSTVIQGCITFAVFGIVTFLIQSRCRVELKVTGLELARVFSKVTINWEDVGDLHSGLFWFIVKTKAGKRYVVWGVLHWTRWDGLRNATTAKGIAAWMTQLAHGSSDYRRTEIHNGVPTGPL